MHISPLTLLMRQIDARSDGALSPDTVPTGFPSIDRLLGGGVRTGDLVVLGGDVGSGKSALALGVALRTALAGHRTLFYSGEMAADRIHERMLAIHGRARIDDIRRGTLDDSARAGIGAATVAMRELPTMAGTLPPTVEQLQESIDRVGDQRLVVVDSVQSLVTGARSTDEEVAAAVRGLKALAVASNVAIVATSHLPALHGDRRPTLDDFGALQAVKQHADVVLGLFREEMYSGARAVEGATELHALKNRNGATGYVDLYFYKQWMRFEDLLEG
jgi:replicative DNA helicase